MMTKDGSTKTFMTRGTEVLMLGRVHISHIVKMHYFFENLLLYSQAQNRQTKYIIMINKYIIMIIKEGSTKIVNFHDPQGKGS